MDNSTPIPSLSIVVNNFNYGRYLREALDSALAQMAPGDELVVVDDGSTDASRDILRDYASRRDVRVIAQPNQGQMKAVRVGLEAARCDVLVLLDSDDYFLAGYLQRLRHIYRDNPGVDYVFCNYRIDGTSREAVRHNIRNRQRMEFTPGVVGATRWATLGFYEFVGVPTSGNSMRAGLAHKLLELPGELDATLSLPPRRARLLGISEQEARKSGYSADGVIVRAASVLGAVKFYDEQAGFCYRIHGANRFAAASKLGQFYLRRMRRTTLTRLLCEQIGVAPRPTAQELHREVLGRSYGRRLRRRCTVRARYCLAILGSEGTIAEKYPALMAALGLPAGRRAPLPGSSRSR